jgi:hypothetical protein
MHALTSPSIISALGTETTIRSAFLALVAGAGLASRRIGPEAGDACGVVGKARAGKFPQLAGEESQEFKPSQSASALTTLRAHVHPVPCHENIATGARGLDA